MSKTRNAQLARIKSTGESIEYLTQRLMADSAPIRQTPLLEWLDALPEDITVMMYSDNGETTWHVYLTDPQSSLPRQLLMAQVGVHKLEKSPDHYGSNIQQSGTSDRGEHIVIHGYLGTCRVEYRRETVRVKHVVCSDGDDNG